MGHYATSGSSCQRFLGNKMANTHILRPNNVVVCTSVAGMGLLCPQITIRRLRKIKAYGAKVQGVRHTA